MLCLLAVTAANSTAAPRAATRPRTTAPATRPATRPATGPATRPATQPVSETAEMAARALRLPRTWPGADYEYARAGRTLGHVVQRTEASKLDGRDVLKLTDVLELTVADRTARMTYTTWCEPDAYLTPIRITGEGEGFGREMGALDVRFEAGRAVGTLRGKPVVVDVRPPVVTELALFRVVTLMPLREGAELRFRGLQSTEMRPKGEQLLRCVGQEKVWIGGRAYGAWKFEHTGEGILKSTYWVNGDRFFLKAQLDGYKDWNYSPKK